jgi:hypothetical protein
MYNLACSYLGLERHQDAVEIGEKAIEFMQRAKPESHTLGATRMCLST